MTIKALRGILYICAFFFIVEMIILNTISLLYPYFVEMTPEIEKELVLADTMSFRYFVQGFVLLIYLKVTK